MRVLGGCRQKSGEQILAGNQRQLGVAIEGSFGFKNFEDGIEDLFVPGDLLNGFADQVRANRRGMGKLRGGRALGARRAISAVQLPPRPSWLNFHGALGFLNTLIRKRLRDTDVG